MKPKRVVFKNGASVSMEKLFPSGMYLIECRSPAGELHDKTRCDSYSSALDYWRSFKEIARKSPA